jgi:hypothetical protein
MAEGISGLLLAMGSLKQPQSEKEAEGGGGAAAEGGGGAAAEEPLSPDDLAPSLRRSSRKRVPSWDDDPAEDTRGKKDLPAEAAAALKHWMLNHFDNPYPTHEVRSPLAASRESVLLARIARSRPAPGDARAVLTTTTATATTTPRTRCCVPLLPLAATTTTGEEGASGAHQDPDAAARQLVHEHAQAHLEAAAGAPHSRLPVGRGYRRH